MNFEPEISTPQSLGAMAALKAKTGFAETLGEPIDIRRACIAKRKAAGHDTPIGHTYSNMIEILDGLFEYDRPGWATDVRQTLPYLMNKQIERLAALSAAAGL